MVSLTALVLTTCWSSSSWRWGSSRRVLCNDFFVIARANCYVSFVATFVHTLLAIREFDLGDSTDPGHVPGVAVLATFVLALTSIAVLVMYVHHVGQALRISALVELAGNETRRLLDRVYPDQGPVPVEERDWHTVTATKSGRSGLRRPRPACPDGTGCRLRFGTYSVSR